MTKSVKEVLMTVLSEDDARAVIDHRRVTIKRPLTVRGAQNLAKQFALVDDTSSAVDLMIDKCWQGFKASWYENSNPPGRMTQASARLYQMYAKEKQERLN